MPTEQRVPFSFSYRSLYRTTPDPGGIVKIRRLDARGRLEDSFAVAQLTLPPYTGSSQGELPVFAAGYLTSYLGYATRVGCYAMLLVDRYPPFALDAPDYPVRVELEPGPLIVCSTDINQRWVADMGLPGPDAGKGGKHLLLPPGYQGAVPASGLRSRYLTS